MTEPGAARLSPKAERLVAEVARRHFDEKPKRVRRCGGGLTNSVFEFRVSHGDFILRSHDNATKISDYLKEHWAMQAAHAAGVPTPKVLEVGNFSDGRPYMIAERVHGTEGRIAGDRLELLAALGRCAALLHGVRTHGFGSVFDWSSNQLSRHASWPAWLTGGFDPERRLGVLLRHRMLSTHQAVALRRVGAAMGRWRKPPVLQHGDLRLKNVIVDPDSGKLRALIDWEGAMSLPTPWWDLSLALHELGTDEKEAFLAGYGLKPRVYEAGLPFLRFFNVLNYAHAVESAAAGKDSSRLELLRVRLQGGTDLYGT